jgi:hypothetical protein
MNRNGLRIVSGVHFCARLAILVLLLLATERPAKAYVDPGSGALVWQGMLASLLGAAFYFRRAIGWIKHKVCKTKPTPPPYTRTRSEPIAR